MKGEREREREREREKTEIGMKVREGNRGMEGGT